MVARKDVSQELVDQAISIYLRHAYGSDRGPRHSGDASDDVFRMFVNETRAPEGGRDPIERYAMRLGNRNYPFMKLVLQEHVLPGEFYFAVDTHDQMEIRPDFPDYEAWMKVKRFNLGLKKEIEEAFASAGLPTLGSIRERVANDPALLAAQPRPDAGPTILVVDDEEDEARTLEVLLRREGYEVVLAGDGREALERLALLRPSLIVLDYEMPELDGLAVISELRSHEETRCLPILLTTASEVLGSEKEKADGFLAKPFRGGDLLKLVQRLLDR